MLTIRYASTTEEITRVFVLTERVYRAHGYIAPEFDHKAYSAFLWELHEKYDTTYLMAIPEGEGEPVAAVSLMASEKHILPTEHYFDVNLCEMFRVERSQIWEISRLVSESNRSGIRSIPSLVCGICDYAPKQHFRLASAGMKPSVISELERTTGLTLKRFEQQEILGRCPDHYRAWFQAAKRQMFVIEEAGGRDFVDQWGEKLTKAGVVFDL
jgi:hypothetical protein